MRKFTDGLALAIATGLGTGYSPFAPGTVATPLGIGLYLLIQGQGVLTYGVFTILVTLVAVAASARAEKIFGVKDCRRIVVDEIAGVPFMMALLPPKAWLIVVGFFIYRFFDIVKPPPANIINRDMEGGWGIVLDDVVAGIYTNLVLHLIVYITGI